MELHKKIAMRCTKEQFENIKPKLEKLGDICGLIGAFEKYEYITNNFNSNISEKLEFDFINSNKGFYYCHNGNIHEQWDEKVFLEACGISEIPTLEEVKEYFKNAKKIKSVISDSIYKINTEKLGVYFDGRNYRQNTNSDDSRLLLWEENKGYAEIISENYKITKETILKYNMKDEFPEIFEVELKKGVWYWRDNDELAVWNNCKSTYGFVSDSKDFVFIDKMSFSVGITRKATPQEVEESLIREANKISLIDDNYIKSTSGVIGKLNSGVYVFDFRLNKLYYSGYEIFDNGVWATVIKTITKEEAEKQLNCKII